METMPTSLRKVANSFGFTGKSAEQDLYKALQSGQITMDQLNDRFIKLNKGQNGFAALAKKNSAGIRTSFTNLGNAVANNMTNMLERINQGFSKAGLGSIAQQLDNLKGAINAAFKAIGPAVTSGTVVAINAFKGLFNAMSAVFSFIGKNKNWLAPLAVGIGTFAASFAGITKTMSIAQKVMAGLKIAGEIKTVGPVLMAMAKGSSAASSALTFMAQDSKLAAAALKVVNAVAAMNPWVILAAAIIAVVAALTFFFTQTKTGRAMWAAFTSWLAGAWQNLVSVATTVWNAIGNAITTVVNVVKAGWQGLTSFLTALWTGVVTIATGIWNGLVAVFTTIVTAIEAVWTGISTFFTTLWTGIVTVATTIWNSIVLVVITVVTTIEAAWSGFTSFISSIWEGIVVIATTIWDTVVSVISGAWSTITGIISGSISVVQSVISAGFNAARSIVSSVMNAMKGVISAVWNGIQGLFNAGVSFIKSVVHVDLSAQGRAIMQSLWDGMKAVWEGIKGFVSNIAGWIKSHKGPISLDRRLLIPAGNAIMEGLNSGLVDGFKTVQSTVTSMTNTIARAASVPAFTDTIHALNSMSDMNINADGTISSTQTISNVNSRNFEARMTRMFATAIDKLDNVDQKPVVTFDTASQMHQATSKADALSYITWRGE